MHLFAASLLFSSTATNNKVAIQEQFKVTLKLDTQGAVINALETRIAYPHDLLRLAGIENGSSFLTMWLESPHEQDGQISLSGVTPGGFSGVIDALTYPKTSPGDVVTLIFEPIQAGEATISATSSTILLNDGHGGVATLTYQPITVTVQNYVHQTTISNTDTTPPEFVYGEAHYDATLAGEYVFFDATDKESGIDHYEAQENGLWVTVQSPHLINQNGGVYYIKAIDRAGNEKIKGIQVPAVPQKISSGTFLMLAFLGLLIIFYAVYLLIKKWLKK